MYGYGYRYNKYLNNGGGGAVPFDPSQLNNLRLWLDSTDASTINLGSPVNNDLVDNWNDKSSNSFDFLSTGTLRPTYKSSGMGSQNKPYIEFDTSNDMLSSSVVSTASRGMI